MLIQEYEKAVISVILNYYTGNEKIPEQICSELDDDKFDPKGPHGIIYRSIQRCVIDGKVPNIINVCRMLGENLEAVGGEIYLNSLRGFLSLMGSLDVHSWETWMRYVDSVGRLRHMGLVVDEYHKMYENFELMASQVNDVDVFISNFLTQISKCMMGIKSNYEHISVAINDEKRRLDLEKQGQCVDWIPMGWPSLQRYYIPRPSTFGVLTGLSSMGKTQFALQIMLGTAIHLYENNLSGCVAINELEMPKWRLSRRLACCMTGINSDSLRSGDISSEKLDKYYDNLDYISQLPIYIDDNPNLTSDKLSWEARALNIEKGRRLGVVDYFELFKDKGENEELRVSNVVRNQKALSMELGSCEIGISQLNNSVMLTGNKIGGAARARYSGAIWHAADWLGEIYNPPQMRKANIDFSLPKDMDEDRAYILIEKNKDGPLGQEAFIWTPEFTRFQDVGLTMGEGLYRKTVKEDDF